MGSTTSIVERLASIPEVPVESNLDAADEDGNEDSNYCSKQDEAVACTDSPKVQEVKDM